MSAFTVAPAAAARTAEVLALLAQGLPALAQPLAPAPRLFAALDEHEPGQLMGAAALWTLPQRGGVWGFKVHVQVQSGHGGQGLGRALVAAAAQEAVRWGVPRLITWDTLMDGPASAFVQALGARVAYTLHHYLPDKATALPRCAQVVRRLHRLGHVPPGFGLRPLHELPREPVLALHCAEFHARPAAAAELFDTRLADPEIRDLSVGLWDGRQLAGYLLAGRAGGLPEVEFWASAPGHRSGWAAALLVHAFVERGIAAGGSQARYHCNTTARAPMNFARRTGTVLERVTQGWCLALPAEAPPSHPMPATGADEREVVLALPGLSLPDLRAACRQGQLPELAQLLVQGRVQAEGPLPWRDGQAVHGVGWPAAQAPRLTPGGVWVADSFDDLALIAPDFWALDPASVQPDAARALARAARMPPAEVHPAQLDAVLAPLEPAAQDRLSPVSAWLLARWASRHNLGVHWAAQSTPGLVAVRFDGLPEWLAAARLDPADRPAALAGWLSFFDLLLGRYRRLVGELVPLSLRVDAD